MPAGCTSAISQTWASRRKIPPAWQNDTSARLISGAGGQVWAISAWDAARIGELAATGALPNERVYAAVGAGLKQPRFVRTLIGAPIAHVTGEPEGDNRTIRGSVLTGTTTELFQYSSKATDTSAATGPNPKRSRSLWLLSSSALN